MLFDLSNWVDPKGDWRRMRRVTEDIRVLTKPQRQAADDEAEGYQ